MDQPFGDCKNDSLHNMGQIQSYGAIIACNATDHKVVFCSQNTGQVIGLEPAKVLGSLGVELFPDDWNKFTDPTQKRSFHFLTGDRYPTKLVAAVHQQGDKLLLEFEPVDSAEPHWWNYAERMEFLDRLDKAKSITACHRLLVRYLFEHIGFDRVMLYEFEPDMHGSVVEERVAEGVDSFLGLHFPPEDIPPNAQVFYTKNWQRLIADIDAETVPVVGLSATPDKLDLTGAMLRAVHPVHLQYLKNMGVQASFSLSVLVKGQLYGLVACHHGQALRLNLADRLAYEEIARMVSIHLEKLIDLNQRDSKAALEQQLTEIREKLPQSFTESGVTIAQYLGMMQEVVGANAAWLHYGGEDYYSGPVPPRETLEILQGWFKTVNQDVITSYSRIPDSISSEAEMCKQACGTIYIPLDDGNFLAFLRAEVIQNITWAGQPQSDDIKELSPRSSFKAWTEQRRGTSIPWTDMELAFAEKLRVILLKYVNLPAFE